MTLIVLALIASLRDYVKKLAHQPGCLKGACFCCFGFVSNSTDTEQKHFEFLNLIPLQDGLRCVAALMVSNSIVFFIKLVTTTVACCHLRHLYTIPCSAKFDKPPHLLSSINSKKIKNYIYIKRKRIPANCDRSILLISVILEDNFVHFQELTFPPKGVPTPPPM